MNKIILNKLFELADKSLKNNEFPVSAIIYKDNDIISYGYNNRNKTNITVNHAEIIAITNANKKLNSWQLPNTCMIVTLEPCDMCKQVISEARIKEVYYLVPRYNYKKPYKGTIYNHLDLPTKELDKYIENITSFFKDKR